MHDRPTLPQRRALETREQILEAAARVFARKAFGGAPVSEIAAEAGVSVGAVYHHFASKEEIFRALLDQHIRTDLTEFASLPLAGGSFRQVIERVVGFWITHLEAHRGLDPLFMEFWAQATREEWARRSVAEFLSHGRDLARGILRVGKRVGAVRRDLHTEAAATLLHAVFQGIWVEGAIDRIEPERPTLLRALSDMIERFVEDPDATVDEEVLQSELAAWTEKLSRRAFRGNNAVGDGDVQRN